VLRMATHRISSSCTIFANMALSWCGRMHSMTAGTFLTWMLQSRQTPHECHTAHHGRGHLRHRR
jgi:hypothetical protein